MEKNKNRNNKTKSDKKIYIIFAVVVLLCMLAGFFAGMMAAKGKNVFAQIDLQGMWRVVAYTLPIAYVVTMVIVYVITFVMYAQTRKSVRNWDGEDEDVIDAVEKKLNLASVIDSIYLFAGFVIFPVCLYAIEKTCGDVKFSGMALLTEITFLCSLGLYMTAMKLIVDEEKRLNPEKKGNVFDMGFKKDWEGSMDEGELDMMAKYSKKGFRAGIVAGYVMWLITFVSMFAFDTGVLPVVAVSVVLLVMYTVYAVESVRLQK